MRGDAVRRRAFALIAMGAIVFVLTYLAAMASVAGPVGRPYEPLITWGAAARWFLVAFGLWAVALGMYVRERRFTARSRRLMIRFERDYRPTA